jgi:ATP-dependent helicase/nuclease subunit B
MSVQFILGRSGTGKTRYCINEIVEELLDGARNQPLILLVPEQATYQAERAVLSDPRIAGFNRLKILSFQRLQYQLLGKNADKPTVSQIGREMIIQRILRQEPGRFKLLYRSTERAGLAVRLAQTVSELLRYAKSPDDIDRLLTTLQKEKDTGLTALKFADIGLIFKEYLEFIEGRFVDSDIQLNQICGALGEAGFVKNGRLWVDGFSSFNGSEYAVLAELLRTADESKIAICMDPSEIDLQRPQIDPKAAMSLFYPTLRTYVELTEIIKKAKLKTAPPVILNNQLRFSDSRPLAHIEANIFGQSSSMTSAEEKIRIISAPNRRAEVEFTAAQILELVRKKGFRYRDIAVIASDIETYQHYIRAYFEDYRIPFFIDSPKPLCRHPVIQLICSAVSAATAGFSNSDIFAYLKTDLTDIGRGDVDLLINYCIAYGICPDDWTSQTEWNFAAPGDIQFDQKHINLIRRKASGDLLELRDRLCCAETEQKILTAEDFTRIIFDFLDKLEICEKLSQWIVQAQSEKDYETAELHRQFYDRLLEVFDEFIEVFAGRLLTAADYYSIIRSAFSQLQLALIPPTLEEVLVGSIERSRHPDLKAVFLLGATANQCLYCLYQGFAAVTDNVSGN